MRRPPLVLVVALLALAAPLLVACESSSDDIATDAVARATVVEIVDAPASVTARAVATLSAPAEGTLTQLRVQPGQSVTKGQIVAVIDSPAARKRLGQARSALAAASSVGVRGGYGNLTRLQDGLDRSARDAFVAARSAAGTIPDEALRAQLLAHIDEAQRRYDSAAQASRAVLGQLQRGLASIGNAVAALGAAQRAQAQAGYDVALATVQALTLRAPIAGVVQYARPVASSTTDPLTSLLGALGSSGGSSVAGAAAAGAGTGAATGSAASVAGVDDVLAVGDQVASGQAIVTIVDISQIGLIGEVDETDVLLVTPGISAEVELDAAPGLRYPATVSSIDILPTPSSRGGVAYRIRLLLGALVPGDGGIVPPTPRPGMSAVAHLKVRTATAAIAVPASAVFATELGDAVWVIRDGRATRQLVRVGVQGEDLLEVLAGLEPGQRVVVRGVDHVKAGDKLP